MCFQFQFECYCVCSSLQPWVHLVLADSKRAVLRPRRHVRQVSVWSAGKQGHYCWRSSWKLGQALMLLFWWVRWGIDRWRPLMARWTSTQSLNSIIIICFTGSQWGDISADVWWFLGDRSRTSQAAAFITRCSGASVDAGSSTSRALQ